MPMQSANPSWVKLRARLQRAAEELQSARCPILGALGLAESDRRQESGVQGRTVGATARAGTPLALRPETLHRSLQWRRPHTSLGGNPEFTGHHESPPGVVFATSSRRIVCSSSRTNPRWTASRIFAGACRRVTELLRTTARICVLTDSMRTATPGIVRNTRRTTPFSSAWTSAPA
jgi:hypothetical protein